MTIIFNLYRIFSNFTSFSFYFIFQQFIGNCINGGIDHTYQFDWIKEGNKIPVLSNHTSMFDL